MPPSSFSTPEWPAIADIENMGFTPEDLITWLEGLSAEYAAALQKDVGYWSAENRPEAADRISGAETKNTMRQQAISLAIAFLRTLGEDGKKQLSLGNPASMEKCRQQFRALHEQAGDKEQSIGANTVRDGWHAVTLAWSGCTAREIMAGLPHTKADALRAACAEKVKRLVHRAYKKAIGKYWQRETEAHIQDLLRRGTAEVT